MWAVWPESRFKSHEASLEPVVYSESKQVLLVETERASTQSSPPTDGSSDELRLSTSFIDDLSRTAAIAARTFDTWEEATEAVLEILMALLGMQSVYLTRIEWANEPVVQRVVASRNASGAFSIPVGLEVPLKEAV